MAITTICYDVNNQYENIQKALQQVFMDIRANISPIEEVFCLHPNKTTVASVFSHQCDITIPQLDNRH